MKVYLDGSIEGSPAECAEYLRLKDSAPVDIGSIKFVPIGPYQPYPWGTYPSTGTPWRVGDVTWCGSGGTTTQSATTTVWATNGDEGFTSGVLAN